MLKRKIENRVESWKATKTNQGLLITGARQTGKTSSIEAFGRERYEAMVKIDFVEQPRAVEVISEAQNLSDLIMRITALAERPLAPESTLLFFDEVQRCADAITWMRYLAEDDRFDVIYSGSMLGVEAYDFRSLPVGTIDIEEMFPLDFEEFCWSQGTDPTLWDAVKECFAAREPVPDFLHEMFLDLWLRYVLIGGMPEAVQVFADTHDTQLMRARQRGILDTYRADITRYVKDRVRARQIKTIFDAVPSQLNKESKRFIISGATDGKRFSRIASDFDWLADAGVVIPVHRATEATFPLGLSEERSYFKLYQSDVGLLFATFPSTAVEQLLARSEDMNLGAVFENAVAQELRAHGHERLYYFNKRGVGEVDFMIDAAGAPYVVPIEVKSGKSSKRHAALDALLGVKNYKLEGAIVLHRGNLEQEGPVTYLPIYMVALL